MKYTRPLTRFERRRQRLNAWLDRNGWFAWWLGVVSAVVMCWAAAGVR